MSLKISEDDFQGQVTHLAEILGYGWVHFRKARTKHGWVTPVSGTLGEGWPDLVLVRKATASRTGRVVFAECKAKKGRASADQKAVVAWLQAAGQEAYIWWPQDLDRIKEILER